MIDLTFSPTNAGNPDNFPSVKVFGVVKIGRQEHLKHLLDGKIRFTPLSTYTKRENKNEPWYDRFEEVSSVSQALDTCIILQNEQTLEKSVLNSSTGLKGPVVFQVKNKQSKVFCLHALYSLKWERESAIEESEHVAYENSIKIPSSFTEFGEYVWVIKNFKEFSLRLKSQFELLGISWKMDLVRYTDFKNSNLALKKDLIGFVKDVTFCSQREHRIMIFAEGDSDLTINVGNLADISYILSLNDFNSKLKIHFES